MAGWWHVTGFHSKYALSNNSRLCLVVACKAHFGCVSEFFSRGLVVYA